MIQNRDIKVIHIEPTDVCQAQCPLCARETDSLFDKTSQNHLTVSQIQSLLTIDDIKNLDKVFMCGNFGDPAAGKHTIEIFRYFREINENITLGMNTNGALRNKAWWTSLGELFNKPYDYVVFSIDGLADTNDIYRINVNWDNLMENTRCFIDTGACAQWDMLVYKHNEHQVDECQELARKMGFKWFRAKVSSRGFTDKLQSPSAWQNTKEFDGPIECFVLKEKSMYISATGQTNPCCWLASTRKSHDFYDVQNTWVHDPNPICKRTCSVSDNVNRFKHQWQRETKLNE
jgi:MoaA/NifB/PqqE/SkfB family radical SAM enzyme